VGYQNLFPAFIGNAASGMAGFVFSLLTFISSTPLLSGYILIKSMWEMLCLSLVALAGARLAFKKAQSNSIQVNTLLSGLATKEEPRAVDGQSAEAEYAIEHPLVGRQTLKADSKRALDLYYESVRCHQDGNIQRAMVLNQEAMSMDPSLHEHAYEALSGLAQNCSAKDAGAIYYWLGIHAEHRSDWPQAAVWYEKAINAFGQLGYRNRESRVHCNLGKVKMRMNDPSGLKEYEKAIALNPRDGTAHLSIARMYYATSYEGDDRFERALDAFADAILADPLTYGPMVVSSLREIGYSWKEDLEKITKKIESKQH
jgi:tetratricopeptide (TPR) repeat protein